MLGCHISVSNLTLAFAGRPGTSSETLRPNRSQTARPEFEPEAYEKSIFSLSDLKTPLLWPEPGLISGGLFGKSPGNFSIAVKMPPSYLQLGTIL